MELTHELLLLSLSYDSETGVFTHLKNNTRSSVGDVAGCVDGGYVKIKIKQMRYKAHRLAWFYMYGKWPDNDIDHINGNRSDNRIANLRDVPRSLNAQNIRKPRADGSSGYLGVSYFRGRWIAQIFVDGKNKQIGSFDAPVIAHEAYLQAKRKFHPGCTI